jgi:hypothetical protein
MKFAVIALFAAAAATASVDAKTTKLHVRVHAHNEKQGAICYKQCPQGQWCSRGQSECRGPKAGTTECFNYATALWIPKCDPGFVCRNGKCDYAKKSKSATKHHEHDHDEDDDDEGDDEERDGDDDDEERDGDDDEDEHEGEDDGEGPPLKHVKSHRQSKQGAICYKQCPQGQWCARGTQTCRGPKSGTTECFNYATALWIPKCDPGFVCRNGKCDYAKKLKSATKHHDHDHDEDDEGDDEERDGDDDDEERDGDDDEDEHEGEDDGEGPPAKHAKRHQSKQGAICYKQCPQGQWCARGTQTCRGPKAGTSECFNYATAQWIAKCDPGFVCRNGKCDYK